MRRRRRRAVGIFKWYLAAVFFTPVVLLLAMMAVYAVAFFLEWLTARFVIRDPYEGTVDDGNV